MSGIKDGCSVILVRISRALMAESAFGVERVLAWRMNKPGVLAST